MTGYFLYLLEIVELRDDNRSAQGPLFYIYIILVAVNSLISCGVLFFVDSADAVLDNIVHNDFELLVLFFLVFFI